MQNMSDADKIDERRAEPSFSDALSVYSRQVEVVHRFWNYLWLVGSATVAGVGLSASGTTGGQSFGIPLLIGFLTFAAVNATLVYTSQRDARLTAKAIVARWVDSKDAKLDSEFGPVLRALVPWRPCWTVTAHFLMDAFVVLVIVAFAIAGSDYQAPMELRGMQTVQNQTSSAHLTSSPVGTLGTGVFLLADVRSTSDGGVRKEFVENLTYEDCVERGRLALAFKWVPHAIATESSVKKTPCGDPCVDTCIALGCLCFEGKCR